MLQEKKLLRRKQAQWATGVLRKTYKSPCFKQVSVATIPAKVTLQICPIFACFCTVIFPLLTYMGVWSVVWQARAKTQTKPAKKWLFVHLDDLPNRLTARLQGSRGSREKFPFAIPQLKVFGLWAKAPQVGSAACSLRCDYYKVNKNSSKNVLWNLNEILTSIPYKTYDKMKSNSNQS